MNTATDIRPAAPAVVRRTSIGSLQVERVTRNIGAEIGNVNLGDAARDPALMGEMRRLLLQHRVLFFRDQDITRAEHVAFARFFGELEDHPKLGSAPDAPGLVLIYKDLDSKPEHYENCWHADGTWRPNPPFGSVLRCVECPTDGGDTIWANMVAAYEGLPQHVKDQVATLRAAHSIEYTFGAALPMAERQALARKHPQVEHPVVRTHPETGEKILFVNPNATHFVNYHTPANVRIGLDFFPGASDLLRYLVNQVTCPEYQVRFRWRANSVAFWDNRATQHYAVQDYWPGVRKMERAGIVGDIPV
jgi:taurine dioxygenase